MAFIKFLLNAVVVTVLCKSVELLPKENLDKRSTNSLPPCDNGWHSFDHYCYNFISNLTSWKIASEHCSSHDGHLASIHSEQQNDFITHSMMEKSIKNWWIGLYDPGWGKYVWEDESDIDFSNCGTTELPNLCHMSETCIEMFVYAQGRVRGLWRDAECSTTKSFVCQKRSNKYPVEDLSKMSENSSSLCEDGWHQYDQHCLKLEKNSLNWEAAASRCYSLGGYLASIHSARQNDFLENLTLKNLVRKSWIGLHDHGGEGLHTWEDGSDIDYTKWRPGEPSGHNANTDDCVLVDYARSKGVLGGWADSPCSLRLPYICQNQIPTLSNGSTSVTFVKKISPCGKDWMHNGDYCYKLVKTPLKFHDASIYCGSLNGYLASIHSQEQQDFIAFFILRKCTSDLWIGLHDTIKEGNFTWVDGLSYNYLNWGRGQPSGFFNHVEDCVVLSYRPRSGNTGQWNDVSCSEKRGFICQKKFQETEYRNELKCESHGFVSVTTFFIIIILVIVSMTFLGFLLYYKRVWLQDKRAKIGTVLFKSSETDKERLTEIDIKDNENVTNDTYRNRIF